MKNILLILGAQVKPDGSPSVQLALRLETALAAYRASPCRIIACGAQGADEPRPEGEVMRDWLIARGAAPSDVLAETDSRRTRQNLQNAAALLPPGARVTVVTSDYHLPRAKTICRKEKLSLAGGRGSRSRLAYLPKSCAREILAWGKFILVYFLRYS